MLNLYWRHVGEMLTTPPSREASIWGYISLPYKNELPWSCSLLGCWNLHKQNCKNSSGNSGGEICTCLFHILGEVDQFEKCNNLRPIYHRGHSTLSLLVPNILLAWDTSGSQSMWAWHVAIFEGKIHFICQNRETSNDTLIDI